jgi:hypothetical protein
MPEAWIDDDLSGAEAVAYRIDWDVFGISCALHVQTHIYQSQFYPSGTVDVINADITHTIAIPNSFMRRVSDYDQAAYKPNSLFKELK